MKQISHDELRTRFVGQGNDIDTVEEKLSCYTDCKCAELETKLEELNEAIDHARRFRFDYRALEVLGEAQDKSRGD